jgi:hypothetical protein
MDFAKTHGWNGKELADLAETMQKRRLLEKLREQNVYLRLPRLLFLANFWEKFYLLAKYGMEAGSLAPPRDLFEKCEVELAIRHAEECQTAAVQIRCLDNDQINAIMGRLDRKT